MIGDKLILIFDRNKFFIPKDSTIKIVNFFFFERDQCELTIKGNFISKRFLITNLMRINSNKKLVSINYFDSSKITVTIIIDVFINEKYIVVTNINGISIYPTIINNINEGK